MHEGRALALLIAASTLILASSSALCPAQSSIRGRYSRRQAQRLRKKNIDWCARNGVILKGMTREEVMKVYGRPDKRFNYNLESGRLERWTYNYPRRRIIIPFDYSPFEMRYRYLYFRDGVLVNFHN